MRLYPPGEFKSCGAQHYYLSALDPEDLKSISTYNTEWKLLNEMGFVHDNSAFYCSTGVIETLTPTAIYDALKGIGKLDQRASVVTLSGHGRADVARIIMTDERTANDEGTKGGFASYLTNIDLAFVATCHGGKHLRHYMNQTPGPDSQRPILVGYEKNLAPTRSVLASAIIQRTIEAGVDLRAGHDQLKLPGAGFWILYPGASEPDPVTSLSAGAESKWKSLAQQHLASL